MSVPPQYAAPSPPWQILAIRRPDDPPDPRYPPISPNARTVVSLPGEISQLLVESKSFAVARVDGPTPIKLMNSRRAKSWLTVTDRRVIFHCPVWNRPVVTAGGGGLISLITLTFAGGRLLAARAARRGRLLVGHIPFETLSLVGYQLRTRGRAGGLRLGVEVTGGPQRVLLALDITVGKGIDPGETAKRIASLAAMQRLQSPALSGAARTQLELAAGPTRIADPEPKKTASYRLPEAQPIAM